MKILISLALVLFLCLFSTFVWAKDKVDIIVAQDGSGQFTKIQDAINSVPAENNQNVLILIRNGVYHEKLFITKSFITLVGEDRDSTRIIYAQLRSQINRTPLDMNWDWGTAVINIDTSVTDFILANLTVHNNYGSLHHDEGHQFAIRGGGTRILILNCNVLADGGDTLSLWNKRTACITMPIAILKEVWILSVRVDGAILLTVSFLGAIVVQVSGMMAMQIEARNLSFAALHLMECRDLRLGETTGMDKYFY